MCDSPRRSPSSSPRGSPQAFSEVKASIINSLSIDVRSLDSLLLAEREGRRRRASTWSRALLEESEPHEASQAEQKLREASPQEEGPNAASSVEGQLQKGTQREPVKTSMQEEEEEPDEASLSERRLHEATPRELLEAWDFRRPSLPVELLRGASVPEPAVGEASMHEPEVSKACPKRSDLCEAPDLGEADREDPALPLPEPEPDDDNPADVDAQSVREVTEIAQLIESLQLEVRGMGKELKRQLEACVARLEAAMLSRQPVQEKSRSGSQGWEETSSLKGRPAPPARQGSGTLRSGPVLRALAEDWGAEASSSSSRPWEASGSSGGPQPSSARRPASGGTPRVLQRASPLRTFSGLQASEPRQDGSTRTTCLAQISRHPSVVLDSSGETVIQTQTSISEGIARAALHNWIKPSLSQQTETPSGVGGESSLSKGVKQRRAIHMYHQLSSMLIFLNILFVICETELNMQATKRGQDPPGWLWWCALAFAILLAGDLASVIYLEGRRFFTGRHRSWNFLDAMITLLQIADVVARRLNMGFFRFLRCLRMAPAARIAHATGYVQELRFMVVSIRCSLPSLFWAVCVLIIVLLCCSLALVEVVQVEIQGAGTSGVHPDLVPYYGSLGSCMMTLFMALSGGNDWEQLAAPLFEISALFKPLFALFAGCILYGLANILVAIFVDCACQSRLQSTLDHIQEALECADPDSTGEVSLDEYTLVLQDLNFVALLGLINLDAAEMQGLFQVLDIHSKGQVPIRDIMRALMRLTGNARSVDIANTFYENKRILAMVASLSEATKESFAELKDALGLERPLEK